MKYTALLLVSFDVEADSFEDAADRAEDQFPWDGDVVSVEFGDQVRDVIGRCTVSDKAIFDDSDYWEDAEGSKFLSSVYSKEQGRADNIP